MPTYQWQGLSARGRIISGFIDAANDDAVQTILAQRQVAPLSYSVTQPVVRRARRESLSTRDLGLLTRQLAVMIKAGLPVVRALATLERQRQHPQLTALLLDLRVRLEAGESLTDALRAHPRCFGRLYTAMVAAGEATGDMEHVLAQLAAHLDRTAEVRKKLQTALLYPTLVVAVAGAVTGGLLIFVVPVFADLFRSFGHELPWPTRIVVHLSALAMQYAIVGTAVLLAVLLGLHRAYRSPRSRKHIDALCLQAPIFGRAQQRAEIAKLTRVLATVVTAGVPLLQALRLAAEAAYNSVYRDALAQTEVQVREGLPLAQALATTGYFPDDVCQLVAIGESTGTLESSLLKIAELYDAEVDHLLSNFTALIEPVFIGVLGVVVGGILISMYLPIFQIGSLVQ